MSAALQLTVYLSMDEGLRRDLSRHPKQLNLGLVAFGRTVEGEPRQAAWDNVLNLANMQGDGAGGSKYAVAFDGEEIEGIRSISGGCFTQKCSLSDVGDADGLTVSGSSGPSSPVVGVFDEGGETVPVGGLEFEGNAVEIRLHAQLVESIAVPNAVRTRLVLKGIRSAPLKFPRQRAWGPIDEAWSGFAICAIVFAVIVATIVALYLGHIKEQQEAR